MTRYLRHALMCAFFQQEDEHGNGRILRRAFSLRRRERECLIVDSIRLVHISLSRQHEETRRASSSLLVQIGMTEMNIVVPLHSSNKSACAEERGRGSNTRSFVFTSRCAHRYNYLVNNYSENISLSRSRAQGKMKYFIVCFTYTHSNNYLLSMLSSASDRVMINNDDGTTCTNASAQMASAPRATRLRNNTTTTSKKKKRRRRKERQRRMSIVLYRSKDVLNRQGRRLNSATLNGLLHLHEAKRERSRQAWLITCAVGVRLTSRSSSCY